MRTAFVFTKIVRIAINFALIGVAVFFIFGGATLHETTQQAINYTAELKGSLQTCWQDKYTCEQTFSICEQEVKALSQQGK